MSASPTSSSASSPKAQKKQRKNAADSPAKDTKPKAAELEIIPLLANWQEGSPEKYLLAQKAIHKIQYPGKKRTPAAADVRCQQLTDDGSLCTITQAVDIKDKCKIKKRLCALHRSHIVTRMQAGMSETEAFADIVMERQNKKVQQSKNKSELLPCYGVSTATIKGGKDGKSQKVAGSACGKHPTETDPTKRAHYFCSNHQGTVWTKQSDENSGYGGLFSNDEEGNLLHNMPTGRVIEKLEKAQRDWMARDQHADNEKKNAKNKNQVLKQVAKINAITDPKGSPGRKSRSPSRERPSQMETQRQSPFRSQQPPKPASKSNFFTNDSDEESDSDVENRAPQYKTRSSPQRSYNH